MEWITKFSTGWRILFLVLALTAILMGPWFLMDTISVPEPHECSYPYVRIDENFCRYADSYRFTLFSIPSISLLPLISSIMVMIGDNRKWLKVFNFIAWAFAGGYSLFISLTRPEIYSLYYGVRMYIIVAFFALLFELIILFAKSTKTRWAPET